MTDVIKNKAHPPKPLTSENSSKISGKGRSTFSLGIKLIKSRLYMCNHTQYGIQICTIGKQIAKIKSITYMEICHS